MTDWLQESMRDICNELQREIAALIAKNLFRALFPPPGLAEWLAYNERGVGDEKRGAGAVDSRRLDSGNGDDGGKSV